MKKNRLFLIPLLTLWATLSMSQSSFNKYSFGGGYNFLARQDQNFSPFVHQGGSPVNIQFKYQREEKNVHFVKLRVSSNRVAPHGDYTYRFNPGGEEFESYPHIFLTVDLDYGMGKKIFSKGKWDLFAGGSFQNCIQTYNYSFGFASFFGYYASFSLGPWASARRAMGEKFYAEANLSFPVFSRVARSPYLLNDDEFIENTASHNGVKTFFSFLGDGKWNTLNRLQNVRTNVSLFYRMSYRWEFSTGWDFIFIHHNRPLNFLSFQNLFLINGIIKF